MYPNVTYLPVPGLVALFAGSGTHKGYPRAFYSRHQSTAPFSYDNIARKQMDVDNLNGGINRGGNIGPCTGGSSSGQSAG
jgi:hypothetical protein